MTAQHKSRTRTPLKQGISLLLILAAAAFVVLQVHRRRLIQQENQAIQLEDDGRYQEAIEQYSALLPKVRGKTAAERLNRRIAACYVGLADDPGLPADQAMGLYRKAHAHDTQSLEGHPAARRLGITP